MKRDKILVKLKEILGREGFDEENVTPNASLRDDLGMDSLDIVEMTMDLEDALFPGEEIPADVSDEWKTVGEIIEYLEKQPEVKAVKA
jgi:acyl carrier protein